MDELELKCLVRMKRYRSYKGRVGKNRRLIDKVVEYSKNDPTTALLVSLFYFHAWSSKQIANIKISDINFKNKYIKIMGRRHLYFDDLEMNLIINRIETSNESRKLRNAEYLFCSNTTLFPFQVSRRFILMLVKKYSGFSPKQLRKAGIQYCAAMFGAEFLKDIFGLSMTHLKRFGEVGGQLIDNIIVDELLHEEKNIFDKGALLLKINEQSFDENIHNFVHLQKIRKKLLNTDVKSKVSVMIGAGFSRNAAKIEDSFEGMALWDDLKKIMIQDLKNHNNIENKSVLEIGEIYSHEYGRSTLDDLLKSSIPDENYEPTDLYNKLLNLPWADVYTTNYDTLLERSKGNIYERNYQIVYDISDIPTSVQPRIVKLHGSFPANRPFVFTQKDYDDYPVKFSPFVNMVQQSIMESTFLLMGFSGDDPNFEKWTSWVRDNLKEHMPKIYMIGINEEENEEILEKKGITLIDFKNLYSNPTNYYQMFNDLFEYLKPQKEEEKTNWPFNDKINLEKLGGLTKKYPGWVVLPDNIRRSYYPKINEIIQQQFIQNKVLRKGNNNENTLSFLKHEDRKIYFIDNEIIKDLINILWFTNTFSIPINIEFEKTILAAIDSPFADGYQLNKFYLALLKERRLENNSVEFDMYRTLIEQQKSKYRDDHSYYYELIQYSIENNELKNATEFMDSWEVGDREPEWGVKKACLYLKVNKVEDAFELFDKYLKVIRRLLAIKNNDYRLLSLESIILSHFKKNNSEFDYSDRLKSLSLKDCHSEKEFVSTLRAVQVYKSTETRQENETFDPEIITTKVSIGELNADYTRYESFVVSQINEQYQFAKNMLEADLYQLIVALENTRFMYKYDGFKKMIILNDKRLVDKLFKRSSIVYIEHQLIDILFRLYEPTLKFENEDSLIDDNNALDIYSRIYMRLSRNEKSIVRNKLLTALVKANYNEFHLSKKNLKLAVKRICKSLNEDELNHFFKELIELEIPEDINSHHHIDGVYFNSYDFFDAIYVIFDLYYLKVNKLKIAARPIKSLLDKLEHSKNPNVQSIAFVRLLFLAFTKTIKSPSHKNQLNSIVNDLPFNIKQIFKELINMDEYVNDGVYDFFDKNNQTKTLNKYLSQKVPIFFEEDSNSRTFHSGHGTIHYFDKTFTFFGYFENQNKSKILEKKHYYIWLNKFYEWWSKNKKGLLDKRITRNLSLISVDTILEHLINSLNYSILSTIPVDGVREIDKINLERLFNDLSDENNKYAISMIPLLERLKVNNKYCLNFTKELIDGSSEIENKINGLNSLFLYVAFSKKKEIRLTEDDYNMIMNELKNAINYSEGLLLEKALSTLSKIIDLLPRLLNENYTNFSIRYLNEYLKKLKIEVASPQKNLINKSNVELKVLSSHARLASIVIKYKWKEKFEELEEWKEFIATHPLPEVKVNENNFNSY